MANFWNLCTLGLPTESGKYEVRVCKKGEPLDCPLSTIVLYDADKQEWKLPEPLAKANMEVIAWRCL